MHVHIPHGQALPGELAAATGPVRPLTSWHPKASIPNSTARQNIAAAC